jgi:glycerol-3-phosphate dehydrogenase
MGPRTCIGTTDTRVDSPDTRVTPEDRKFVLDNINKRLRLERPLTPEDVIAERCGVRPLVVRGGGAKAGVEWSQLSRKHVIEANVGDRYVNIFGGKLTDCLNVGEEVLEEVKRLGIAVPYPAARWYGEAPDQTRDEYFHQAELMDLDAKTSPLASEKLSTRLWRRYGAEALRLLEEIRADPREGEILIKGTDYLRCELSLIAKREMIVKLEDLLRRRSKISLVMRREDIQRAVGLREACQLLFGDEADERLSEYFGDPTPVGAVAPG